MENTTAKELMTKMPYIIKEHDTIHLAATLMRDHGCGCLPVANENEVCGMITDRDIVIYCIADNKDPHTTEISEIMNPEIYTCYEDDPIEQVADEMGNNEVRRLVVLGENDKVTGIISLADIVKSVDRDAVNDEVMHHLFKYA